MSPSLKATYLTACLAMLCTTVAVLAWFFVWLSTVSTALTVAFAIAVFFAFCWIMFYFESTREFD